MIPAHYVATAKRREQDPPYDKRILGSLREGAAARARLGESALEKRYKVVNLTHVGSFRHGSAVPPPSE